MPRSLRLTDKEQELLAAKTNEINMLLISRGFEPIRIADLAHKILELSIPYVILTNKSDLILKPISAGSRTKVRV